MLYVSSETLLVAGQGMGAAWPRRENRGESAGEDGACPTVRSNRVKISATAGRPTLDCRRGARAARQGCVLPSLRAAGRGRFAPLDLGGKRNRQGLRAPQGAGGAHRVGER